MKKLEFLCTLREIVKWHNQNTKHITIPQKIKNRAII